MPTNKDGGGDVPFSVFVKKVRNLNKSIRWVGNNYIDDKKDYLLPLYL